MILVLAGIGLQFFGRRRGQEHLVLRAGNRAGRDVALYAGRLQRNSLLPVLLRHPEFPYRQQQLLQEFTLKTMAWVSLAIPFVLAYIACAWRAIDRRRITRREMEISEDKY